MYLRSKDSERVHFYCPSGERIELRHRAVIHKDGKRELVRDREKHTFDIIQSHLEECLIENIIKRCLEGDLTALNKMHGVYEDITGAPKSLAEAQQMIIDLKQRFEELPKDIRQKFDYNEEQYIAEFGTETWAEKTGVAEQLKAEREALKRQETFEANVEKFFAAPPSNEGGETINE